MKSARGFTLIELTMALAVLVVVSGLVIVRAGGWGPRQRVISAARSIGNTVSHYREMARHEERIYALVFDVDTKRISIYAPQERQPSSLTSSTLIRTIEVPSGIEFKCQTLNTTNPLVLYLDRKGVVPELSIEVQQGEYRIRVHADPIVNLVTYDEK